MASPALISILPPIGPLPLFNTTSPAEDTSEELDPATIRIFPDAPELAEPVLTTTSPLVAEEELLSTMSPLEPLTPEPL